MDFLLFDIFQAIGRIIISVFLTIIGRKDLDKTLDKEEYGCLSFILGAIVGLGVLIGVIFLIFKFID